MSLNKYSRLIGDEVVHHKIMPEIMYEKPELHELVGIVRKRKGLSQAELAEKSGVSRNSIAKFERGETAPQLETVIKILEALDYEMGGDEILLLSGYLSN